MISRSQGFEKLPRPRMCKDVSAAKTRFPNGDPTHKMKEKGRHSHMDDVCRCPRSQGDEEVR